MSEQPCREYNRDRQPRSPGASDALGNDQQAVQLIQESGLA
jgi:hypothetical protein